MRNRRTEKLAVCLAGVAVMCAMTGCAKVSGGTEGQEEEVIRIEASADNAGEQHESGQQEQKSDYVEDGKTDDASDNVQDETELEGDVRSIGEDSMVVSKIFTYTEDGKDMAVSYVGEGPDAELITIYFSENTEFIVRTVKNGGVNGDADVEDEAGAFSDIQEGRTVRMTGVYEGEDFRAEQVIIYNFI